VTSASAVPATLTITDASKIKFQADIGGKVYIRNLNEFDPTWAGCCYAFWIDTATDAGRAQLAVLLGAYFSAGKISLLAEKTGGSFGHVGPF
jgi:hypothetical protein